MRADDRSLPPRDWALVITAALVLAVVSLASNVTTTSQLAGDADALLAVRWTLSKLVNSGTVWGGLGILAGWLVGRPARGALAGVVASLLALVAHYGLGRVTGVFGPDIWASNASWFVAAAVLGGPLGVVGAMARRADLWGLAARLVVPVAAVLEPLVSGMFAVPSFAPRSDRIASTVCGLVLMVVGTAAGVHTLRQTHGLPAGRALTGALDAPDCRPQPLVHRQAPPVAVLSLRPAHRRASSRNRSTRSLQPAGSVPRPAV